MSEFINIYNFNGITVLYYKIKNINDLVYKINNYINRNFYNINNFVYIITNSYTENIDFEFIKDKNIILLQTEIDFELFYHLQLLRNDYYYKNNINTENILDFYNKISVPFENYQKMKCYDRRECFKNTIRDNINKRNISVENIKQLDNQNSVYEKIIEQHQPIEQLEFYNKLLDEITSFLNENIDCFKNNIVNFKEFASIYNFEKCGFIYPNGISNNIVLENVYYINKRWYDQNRKPINVEGFYQDFEYREYQNHYENTQWVNGITDITNVTNFQTIEEEVMFLDYVYGFYNFGEFWDVIKRLIMSKKKNLPLFHLSHNRITDIKYYFDKLQFKYPTIYNKNERSNKLYFFHKINITISKNSYCRGYIDKYFAYQFNKCLNPPNAISEKSYNIYLARGSYGRSIINEEQIVNVLKKKYNFIVLNGTESLEKTIHYFTNAKIMLGAHGSLMKNMIWSKKNPVLIELCPHTRHDCFYGNSTNLGFTTFFILTNCGEKEEIILNDEQTENLYKLLENLL